MQGPYEHRDAPQWNVASDEPLGQLRQYLDRLRCGARAVDQPIDDLFDLARRHSSRIDRVLILAHITAEPLLGAATW
jgi:hypothetical protein